MAHLWTLRVCNDGNQGSGICRSCEAGWIGSNCDLQVVAVAVPAAAGALLLIFLIYKLIQRYIQHARRVAALYNEDWKIDYSSLVFAKVHFFVYASFVV
jgi:hypothetical protein